MLEAPTCEVSTPVAELDSACASALRLSGNVCVPVFGWLCAKFEMSIMWPTDERVLRAWPHYKPLMRSIRHAIFIQPLTMAIEAAAQEQIDEETGQKFVDALKRHVDEGQQLMDDRRADDEAHAAEIQAQDDRAVDIFARGTV